MMRDSAQILDLPQPDSEGIAHSEKLVRSIRSKLERAGGVLSFMDYMQALLYEPGLGYYSAGSCKLGPGGDFTTAPEISALFSGCLAVQIEQVLANLESPVVLEIGAGSGRMAVDILHELERRESLPERYLILELSADLRQRQQALVRTEAATLADRVVWLDALPDEPLEAVVVANELLDAMPVRRFQVAGSGVVEQGVCWLNGRFGWSDMPPDPAFRTQIESQVPGCRDLPAGYCSEINPALVPWFKQISRLVQKGAVLLIDYGYDASEYYMPERLDGTLLCHYQHRAHPDPFVYPGLQDVTASVDFTAVAVAAKTAGFDLAGYASQAHFLMGSGLDELMQSAAVETVQQQLVLSQQIKALTLPGEMGERFKVIALSKNIEGALRGFDLQDMSAVLETYAL